VRPTLRSLGVLTGACAALALAAPLAGQAQDTGVAPGGCGPPEPGLNCGPGNGRTTTGGGSKVPHNDGAGHSWPALSGILWQALDNADRRKLGGPKSDELLGHHGSERLGGAGGDDIIWGDWNPKGNTTHQHDILSGGAGNDWIYPSHGSTTVSGGPGRDYVWAYYGKGTINCGPGTDTVRVRLDTGQFKLRNCEIVKHFCAFGDDGNGGCKKPGARVAARAAAQRWG
jgi:Ca2+-binding RTX toxin-like protein